MNNGLTIQAIREAAAALAGVAHATPLDRSSTFSQMVGAPVYLKLENLQKTGSFKLRGAYNKIHLLSETEKKCGVIAASAGNHAQGVAYAASHAGIRSVIVMPETQVRLSAGRTQMSREGQAMCFFAGANSIFAGDKLLTTPNPDVNEDMKMFELLG